MDSVAHKLRSPLRLFIAAILFLVLPFTGIMPRAVAMDEHAMHTTNASLDCPTACARAANLPAPQVTLTENENRLPAPAPQEADPYFQPTAIPVPRVLKPSAFYHSSPSRPPDIVKMSGHFRF